MRTLYRIFRSIVVTVFFTVIGILLLLYIGLSLPPVQNLIRERAVKELSAFLGTKVEIEEVQFTPFNQVVVKNLTVCDRSDRKALQVERVGAGMALWRLITKGDMIFTHAELIGMRASIIQDRQGEPVNIQFIIDAFKPKDPSKPPTKFDFQIRHVIVRRSSASFDRLWKPYGRKDKIDFNHLAVNDFAADVALPQMRNDDFTVDLKRLRLHEKSGLKLEKLQCYVHLTPHSLSVSDLTIELPRTTIHPGDITLASPNGKWKFADAIEKGMHRLTIEDALVCPADIAAIVPELRRFKEVFKLDLDVTGNMSGLQIDRLKLGNASSSIMLDLSGNIANLDNLKQFSANINRLNLTIDGNETVRIVEMLSTMNSNAADILNRLGHVALKAQAKITPTTLKASLALISALGKLTADADIIYQNKREIAIKGNADTDGFNIGTLLDRSDLGIVAIKGNCDLRIAGNDIRGTLTADVPMVEYQGKRWQNINIDGSRRADGIQLDLAVNDPAAELTVNGKGFKNNSTGTLQLTASVQRLDMGALPVNTPFGNAVISGELNADVRCNNVLDLDGEVNLRDFVMLTPGKEPFNISYIELQSLSDKNGERTATIRSPYLNGTMNGRFSIARIPVMARNMLSPAFPSFIKPGAATPRNEYATLNITIGTNDELAEYFNLPIRLLEDVTINAEYDEMQGTLHADIDIPYMVQGKNKLIRNTGMELTLDRNLSFYNLRAFTTMPSKSNEVTLNLSASALNDSAYTNLGWKVHRAGSFGGDIKFATLLSRNPLTSEPEVNVKVLPSKFDINDTTWHVSPAKIFFANRNLKVEGIRIYSGEQFAAIEGKASASENDSLNISLKDIDLDYVFSTLGINYVNFGGLASGSLTGTRLFSSAPIAYTDSLFVKGLTYNHGLLGDAVLRSNYDAPQGVVTILADIHDDNRLAAKVNGGIWVKRDSLSFGLDADKVNIKFLQPFMQAFTSSVSGRASGNALLYGTFKDIDLKGKLFADTIAMKVDFTNTVYSGSDSVYIHPGHIEIPSFKLYDKYGNSANLRGWVKHNYFHEPSFEFNITNARKLLCYETDANINPIWYGTIYGNGGAQISGHPGIVNILVDMSTAPKSVFTFVLSDTQEAVDYRFLTFSDRRKEEEEAAKPDTVPEIIRRFQKMTAQQADAPSNYVMDLRASVTPDAEMILVMDPIAGDKIKAYGQGALQMGYSSFDDRLTMYGRYTLDRGTYNFSLQDLILKTFTIRPGSSIAFNGDPYSAQLNIDALYRVNTNLTDLDPSFANDRDLSRTNVPVDAVLKVNGDMRQPDITFDIELPTLTQDVARKVKSIVSTEDMMSRQIIYLLALNRFYTPEYMGGQGNNNEFASIGFSTLSSHLTNILGQLSPNWSFAPNVRTDQGDFSDLEVDLALSSRLFNNRLILNGNFGYRDRTTSSTTFIGDFDLEYLLNRSGSLRLKAYNHFNDQNYYLKSSLTTQGLGVIYKHDFDRWFSFLRPKRKKTPRLTLPQQKPDTILKFK